MALTEIQTKPKSSGGGGILGSVLGGLTGLIAAPFTGGASIPAAMGAMGAGASLGGLVGNMISPAESKEGNKVQTSRTAMQAMPDVQAAELADASTLVDTVPGMSPDDKSLLKSQFNAAKDELLKSGDAYQKIFGRRFA